MDDFDTAVNRFLGLELRSRTEIAAEVSLTVRDEYLQNERVVQGGIISTLADATAVAVLLPNLPPGRSMASIEFKLNFLQPALGGAGDLVARAALVRSGRTVAVCDVEVLQNDALIAKGLFTYLYTDRR